jgi:branched-chain amino acid transport system substrate-binding protein
MTDAEARKFDRRKFVKLAGAGAGVAVAGPLLNAGAARAAGGIPLRVGVLVPTGSSYAGMGRSLRDGLALGFDGARTGAAPVAATLAYREVERGYGGAYEAAKGLLDDGSDVVVAGVSAFVALQLAQLFEQRKTPLVVANVGAHVVPPAARNRYVLHSSLYYWQSCYMMGVVAARSLGKRAYVASAMADAGYDTIYAFRRGFEVGGGTIVGEGVTHVDPANPGLGELAAAVKSSGADVLFGLHTGSHTAGFLQAAAGSGAKLALGSLGVEDYMLPTLGDSAVGMLSCASWTASRQTTANQLFTKAFQARFRRGPDPFAALGYDTATLIVAGVRAAAKRSQGVRQSVETLGAVAPVEGVRGPLAIEAATNVVSGPLTIRQVRKTAQGLANVDVAKVPAVATFPATLAALGGPNRSGYVNEYLCA